ncbi:MAG: bifunctional, partial [Ottowia sp.]|nr:bifunctional [glutamate--ammonia ligase]-adenylyl-L-tyrosine phosphorylase/[glutamate--ammonia-ligase] adenylyltransferase [Ottowia sp.]
HAAQPSATRAGGADDLKLGRGGIRELEFTVQLLQVVRGGQFPELRCRATLDALPRLAQAGLMPAETAARLAHAYTFLRRVEHRVQYLDDQQTHALPTDEGDMQWLAATMGCGSTAAFLEELQAHRACVSAEFERLLDAGDGGSAVPSCGAGAGDWCDMLAALPPAVRQRLDSWQDNPRFAALREAGRERLRQLLQSVATMLADGQCSEEAALRLTDWLEPLLRRESYIALLIERPAVLARLLRVLGAARWPARYLMRHPGVIDELASAAWLDERFAPARFERALEERRAALAASDEDDEENLLGLLRRAHHAEVFRTLVRDIEGRISVEQVADDLSALADSILRLVARWSWGTLRRRHRDEPCLGLIAYGKLGGKELGYGSDLDLVFVFDDDADEAPAVYGAYVRRIIGWLTVNTGEGTLFEIDTALRPNGNSGLLVSHFAAYADYQQNRGSNTAWTWEHQAMTRARMVPATAPETSDPVEPPPAPGTLHARFAAVREAVLCAPRDAAALRSEILAMRDKLRAAHPVQAGQFDVKHSAGGMVDTEFVTQYLVLAHSGAHPELRPNLGNIALLQRAESLGLLPKNVGQDAAAAYRHLRRLQHQARLNEQGTLVPLAQVQQEAEAVRRLWAEVFGGY